MEKTNKALVVVSLLLVIIASRTASLTLVLPLVGIALWLIATKADKVQQLGALDALYLFLANALIRWALGALQASLNQIFIWADAYDTMDTFATIFSCIGAAVTILIVIAAALALMNVSANKPSNTLLVSGYSKKTLGLFVPKMAPQGYYQPMQPMQQGGTWVCECGRQNDSQFCQGCGKPKK
ncbi:MAG: hypothetical protein E7452_04135 [Ruminococcaceae bacterium]|nr:hypothetical protein [Oscillospiraceae bacterium]MBQ4046985.1 hypothetical protein [Clostridia bacterium]